jgi:3-deoxy-manno-octulosonate cytidylyltransferase (CMP-KDO synthetase)
MNIVSIIPARMGSSRFPGKPMAKILGVPMVGHCFYRSKMCDAIDATYVATCDEEIAEYIRSIGGRAIMTSEKHDRATDRTAEALEKIERQENKLVDIVVMLQGDEPMVTPDMISKAVQPFAESPDEVDVVNLMSEITSVEEFEDPNEVKVVVDSRSDAVYFSREPIPSRRKGVDKVRMLKQVCIIPFKRKALLDFNEMEQTELEIVESVDMLRLLENQKKVRMVFSGQETCSVDTEAELIKVERLMAHDPIVQSYA